MVSSARYVSKLHAASALASGQTLSGAGTISGGMTIASGSVLSPGNSPGTLATGAQTWDDGGSYLWEINNSDGTAGAIDGWMLLCRRHPDKVGGNLNSELQLSKPLL